MKSIFNKSLVFVMVTGMVVAPAQAGIFAKGKEAFSAFIAKNSAPAVTSASTQGTAPAPVASTGTFDKAKSVASTVLSYLTMPFVWSAGKVAQANNAVATKLNVSSTKSAIGLGCLAAAVVGGISYFLYKKYKKNAAPFIQGSAVTTKDMLTGTSAAVATNALPDLRQAGQNLRAANHSGTTSR